MSRFSGFFDYHIFIVNIINFSFKDDQIVILFQEVETQADWQRECQKLLKSEVIEKIDATRVKRFNSASEVAHLIKMVLINAYLIHAVNVLDFKAAAFFNNVYYLLQFVQTCANIFYKTRFFCKGNRNIVS